MDDIISDIASQEAGEDQLFSLIKQAGNEARNRRKKALDQHFNLLREVITDAVSRQRKSLLHAG